MNLLANVASTFSWVCLAQRVPVRIAIDPDYLPAGVTLAAGMTATVVLRPMQQRRDQNSSSTAAQR
ncbi:hypothetical protein [Dokdonella soli]|uniref:p-hydroxybenzoic acid efflux pump subunit AaeA-like beta-barrel domain-containing protein n=1 Tax=Dokdonella soli TaxID=529810 RepID=A0ABN1IRD8_9GAMM